MARKRQISKIADLFLTSEERIEHARKTFKAARATMTNAQFYGAAAHTMDAKRELMAAASAYAVAMRVHARLVVNYAKELAGY